MIQKFQAVGNFLYDQIGNLTLGIIQLQTLHEQTRILDAHLGPFKDILFPYLYA